MMNAVSDESVWGAPGGQPAGSPAGSPVPPPMPGQPGPVPPGWQAPVSVPPQGRSVRRGAMTLIIIVGLLGVGSCGALIGGAIKAARGPIKATDKYFQAIERGDFEAAVALECPAAQSTYGAAEMRRDFADDPVLSWHTHGFSETKDISAPTDATVEGTLTQENQTRPLIVYLTDTDGWRVCLQPFGDRPFQNNG